MTLKDRFDRVGGLVPVKGERFVPLSETEVIAIERVIGGRISGLYRSYLLTFGGARLREIVEFSPVQRLPPSVSRSGRGIVGEFYGAKAHAPNDLDSAVARYRSRMPEQCLPIGGDGGGNQIVMKLGGDHDGAIYYWDHNNEWDDEDYIDEGEPVPPDLKWQNMTSVAPSFDAFLDSLSISR